MKFIKFFVLLVSLVSMGSCESLIEEKIYSKTPENFFLTEADAVSSITAVYAQFLGYNAFSDYYWRVLESASGAVTNPRPLTDLGTILKKTNTSTNAATTDMWDAMYYAIRLSNNVIENVPKMNINLDVRNSVYGEALFLRSMHYFNLVRMFGAVPVRLTSKPVFGDKGERKPESEVYAQIINDLTLAAKLLPTTQGLKGRATKGSAYGLLAKVYLTAASMKKYSGNRGGNFDFVPEQAYYDSTIVNCKRVTGLGYKLVDDFMKQFSMQFTIDGIATPAGFKNSTESLFEIQFASSMRFGSQLPMQLLPAPQAQMAKDENGVYKAIPNAPTTRGAGYTYNDAGWGEFRMTQSIFNNFYNAHHDTTSTTSVLEKQNDYRMDVTFLGGSKGIVKSYLKGVLQPKDTMFTYPYSPRPAPDAAQRWPYLAKYQDYTATASAQHGTNFVYLRYADVLLMQAEAENEKGDNANATKHLNMLMERARKADGKPRLVPNDFSAGLSQDSLRKTIWNERNYELLGEAHLWYDLVRTGEYKSFLKQYNEQEYPLNTTIFYLMDVDDRNLLFPIPYKERSINNAVTQNPGHN